ncbi:MAG: hypothetical protein AB7S48_15940 [Bacteroidales bacterium]
MKNQGETNSGRIPTFHLTIEDDLLIFKMQQDNKVIQEVALNAGYRFIANKFFEHEIPTESETDYAINYIEDELMSNKTLQQNNKELYTSDSTIIGVLRKNSITTTINSRQSIEDLFSRYARVIVGAPASELPAAITRNDFAAILVLREILHHLNFEVLKTAM